MEDQCLFDFGQVALSVEVGGVGDDPPGLSPVHVVEVVPTTKDALRGDRLYQRYGSSAGDWLLKYWRMNLSSRLDRSRHASQWITAARERCAAWRLTSRTEATSAWEAVHRRRKLQPCSRGPEGCPGPIRSGATYLR
jgi:hypothetical protein